MAGAARALLSVPLLVSMAVLGACDGKGGGFLWQKSDHASEPKPEPEPTTQRQMATPEPPPSAAPARPAPTPLPPLPPANPAVAAPVAVPAAAPVAAGEDRLVPFTGKTPTDAPPAQDCRIPGFSAPDQFKVYAAGAYAGRKLDYQIDESGHQATRIDVAVNQAKTPVVLMLGAYEPTVWNIGWAQGTRIAAVLVSGYHRQAIAGLPADVPVLVSSHDGKGPCTHFYVAQQQLPRLNPIAMKVFGRRVDMVYPATDGQVLIGDSLPATGLITSARVSPDSFADPQAPLAGQAGLQAAVREGRLREARSQDMQAWIAARDAIEPALPPVAGQLAPNRSQGTVHNGYVVLKPMRIPAGLYGAHSATFFVPKGVPRPTGDPGHSAIYDFNTLSCTGALCMRD